jgi:hypothetical protein
VVSGKDQKKALKRATKKHGNEFLSRYAMCLLDGPEAVDTSYIEDILMKGMPKLYKKHISRLLDLNQLRSSSPEEQAKILRIAFERGTVELWRGNVVDRDEADRLVAVLGVASSDPTIIDVCWEHPAGYLDCSHFDTLQSLFPVPGAYKVRANAFLAEIQSYTPEDFAERVYSQPAFVTAIAWGIKEFCPNQRSVATHICQQIRATICWAAEARYPPYPLEPHPASRGVLDDLAARVNNNPCIPPCW